MQLIPRLKKPRQEIDAKTDSLKTVVGKFFNNIDFSELEPDFVDAEFSKGNINRIAVKVTIENGVPMFDAPHGHKHTRYPDVKYVIIQTCRKYKIPDCKFIIYLNDAYASQFPAFSIIRRLPEDLNVPFPMGNMRGKPLGHGTSLMGWDEYILKTVVEPQKFYPWESKQNKAVFRGQYAYQTWKLGAYTVDETQTWTDVNRGYLYNVCKEREDLFDVGFNRIGQNNTEEEIPTVKEIPFIEQQSYKYIISVGTNANWAERLRTHLFTNSVLFKHEAECEEWFYPLIAPWKHYVPFDLMMTDLVRNVEWAKENDQECQDIVKNANEFAADYLNEETMFLMAKLLIEKYVELVH